MGDAAKKSLVTHLTKKTTEALTEDALLTELSHGPATLAELAKHYRCAQRAVSVVIRDAQARGVNLHRFGQHWSVSKQPAPQSQVFPYRSRPNDTYLFGVCSDQHLGSKYERLDVLNELYDWFASRGVDRVFNAGNWIDGDDQRTQHDVFVHGMDPQIDYLIANYPKRRGLDTYAVWGEDHEGWYARRESIDIGRYVEQRMREAGRNDWINLGFMEAAVTLQNRKSGVKAPPLVVMHPGGGSAYAISYRPQKLVESLQGGEKPSVLLLGHYHKMSVNLFRSVWSVQCGCVQDQSPFLRKIPSEPHIGGMIIELEQDRRTGAISACTVAQRQYFNRAYENGRWSKSGPVVRPSKFRIGPKG